MFSTCYVFKTTEKLLGASAHSVVRKRCSRVCGSKSNKFKLPRRYPETGKNVWIEFSELAMKYKPKVNVGQGFPDFNPPANITNTLTEVACDSNISFKQYTRGYGHPRLVNVVAKLYSMLIKRKINPLTEVIVTTGAYEALFIAIMGNVQEGDEVIVIEPFFDCYEPMIYTAGGTPRFIPLQLTKTECEVTSSDLVLNEKELRGLFNNRTKMIILNSPHNPSGKVFTLEELELIAELCKKYNVICLSDEVYEWMVFKPKKHIRISTLPGMWERTITIGSVGKSLSVTGWKTGWAYAPASLMANLFIAHQNVIYTCCTPIQETIARVFEYQLDHFGTNNCYFSSLAKELCPKRDFIVKVLQENGFNPIIPDGGYFILADWSKLANKIDLSSEKDKYKDYKFAKYFIKKVGIQGVPPSAFYTEEHKHLAGNYVRYCFVKKDENLQRFAEIMTEWKKSVDKERC